MGLHFIPATKHSRKKHSSNQPRGHEHHFTRILNPAGKQIPAWIFFALFAMEELLGAKGEQCKRTIEDLKKKEQILVYF